MDASLIFGFKLTKGFRDVERTKFCCLSFTHFVPVKIDCFFRIFAP